MYKTLITVKKLNKKQIQKQDSTFTKSQALFMNAAQNI